MSWLTVSRRAILGGSAAAIVAPIGVAAGTETGNPDAELIALCSRFLALEAEARLRMKDDEDEAMDGYYSTIEAIENTPALTDAGNMAKLAAVVAFYDPDPPEDGALLSKALWQAITGLARLPVVAGGAA